MEAYAEYIFQISRIIANANGLGETITDDALREDAAGIVEFEILLAEVKSRLVLSFLCSLAVFTARNI